jgi:8-oxo-dGTP pyrophosphatase MutT (NUDIX family)
MVTTAVFAEIIVAGLQAATWITLVVLAVFGVGWADPAPLADWAALVTLLVLAAAYMLGVMIDRMADNVVLRLNRHLPPRPVDKPASVDEMRMTILARDDGVARFLDYQRSRMRIARVTLLNLLLLIPAVAAFLLLRTDAGILVAAVVVLTCLLCAVLALRVYRNIECAYISRLSEVYRRANAIPETNIAAAVCCDRSDGQLRFGLVQTSDGVRWTFPKGHKRRGETLPEAALREAVEEAGISGRVDGTRLLAYRYPASRRGKTGDDLVAAFVLEVVRVGPPTEPGRALVWCDLEEACVKLAEQREPVYAQEMERVLLAAEAQPEW